jgi:hypothetical protein
MDKFASSLWKRFQATKEEYLTLRAEERRTEAERQKVIERLGLLSKLLELEGKKVDLPETVTTRRRRRAA